MMVYSRLFLKIAPIIGLFTSGTFFSNGRADLEEFLKVPRYIGGFESDTDKLKKISNPIWHNDVMKFGNYRKENPFLEKEIFSISYGKNEGFKINAFGKTIRDDALIAKIEDNIRNIQINTEKQRTDNIKAEKRYKEEKKALGPYELELQRKRKNDIQV